MVLDMDNEVCRLCLADNAAVNIFGKGKNNVLNMIRGCCPVTITEFDGLPRRICAQCLDTLRVCHNFRQQCVDSEKILKQERIMTIGDGIVKVEDEKEYDDIKYEMENDNITSDGEEKDGIDLPLIDFFCGDENETKQEALEKKPITLDKLITQDIKIQTKCRNKINKKSKNTAKKKGNKSVSSKNKDSKDDDWFKKENVVKKTILSHDEMISIRREQQAQKILCDLCGKSIKRANIVNHKRTHSTEKNYSCELCFKSFKVRGNLQKHIRSMHRDNSVICDICKNVYSSRHYLKVHISMVHATGLSYPCDICDRKFKDKRLMMLHKRTHTQERPYQCRFCDSKFTLSSSRLDHERLHTGVTPYQCPCCPKAFVQLSNMKSHFRHNHKEIVFSEVYKVRARPKKLMIDGAMNTSAAVNDLNANQQGT